MGNNPLIPWSELPNLGTTIFTQVSALAQQHQATNLSQGLLDFDSPLSLQEYQVYHVMHGANQYTPMMGVQPLHEVIADKTANLYGYEPGVSSEVTTTVGATEVLYAAVTALVRPGDEVICFGPNCDSYAPAVELSSGVVRRIALQPPSFRVDWQTFSTLLSDRTRLIVLSTPHSPSATVWRHADLDTLWQATKESEIFIISDEVYKHICFVKRGRASVLTCSELRERAVAVSSFGKTYHMIGWEVGYCVAPAAISTKLRKVHQYLTFSVNMPAQLALMDMLQEGPAHYHGLLASYQRKRGVLVSALRDSRLGIPPREGTYLLLVGYSAVSSFNDVELCQWLTTEVDVAAIPLSVFCVDPLPYKLIRPCFAKRESTLLATAERLVSLQLLHSPDFGESTVSRQCLQATDLLQA